MTKTSEVNKKHNRWGTNRYFISRDIVYIEDSSAVECGPDDPALKKRNLSNPNI